MHKDTKELGSVKTKEITLATSRKSCPKIWCYSVFAETIYLKKLAFGRSFYKMGFMALKCPIISRCDFINRRTDNVSYRTLLECELNWSTSEYPHQRTVPRQQFAPRTKICIMAANICGAPVCNFMSLFWCLYF
jgi:hypothetical protein